MLHAGLVDMREEQLDRPADTAISETDIAIIGMAGRFPGAADVDALWQRVSRGEDCLTDLNAADLIAAGLPAELVNDPDYVLRSGIVQDVDMFDADLFGIGPRDASIMDPQHRIFLECVWEAMESAGHVPERIDGAVGVFAGCGFDTYLINNLITNPKLVDQVGWFLLRHTGNDKDFLPTFVSYKLDLRGPSISVQTACSTSLVAIHLAVQSLNTFECDFAIAGGSTIEVPHGVGYRFQEGEVLSPDGHCHAYEAGSAGTVLTSGSGVVVLRRLADALDDGDPILAVVKGTAVNNDGARKVGFLAPSVDGHADAVKEALAVAGLSARDIQLVDGHGTGTAVGDPIEVAALTEAFRATTSDIGFCRLTSTKPNIGHLDTAAGVASVIKVVQALRHRMIPPLANYTTPNPLLDLGSSPFTISPTGSDWPGDDTRRAGVSSLGVGGTNAHVVLEEAPLLAPTGPSRPEQVLCLSGRTPTAVAQEAEGLAAHLEANPGVELADVAHTLAVGRRAMPHRRVVVATDVASAVDELRAKNQRRSATGTTTLDPPGVAFMFPGGGSQYPGMGAQLDERFTVFREVAAEGRSIVQRLGGPDLAPLLAPDGDPDALRQPEASLPAVFVTSVALARQWLAWGVEPDVLIGHSLGEYVAAHIAGVLSYEDALTLVVGRSRLIARVSGGGSAAMLAIPLSEDEVLARLDDQLSLAVINTADECVVAGPADKVEALAAQLAAEDITATMLKLAAAGHSSMLDPVLDEFGAVVRTVKLSPPTMPYLSNLTGSFITAAQATDPQYWVDHLRNTVRFDDCLATALATGPLVTVELGPGQALSSYARRQLVAPIATIPALRHPDDSTPDTVHTLLAFAKQWAAGVPVDLDRFAGDARRRLRLPTYPFQRQRHWIEPGTGMAAAPAVRSDRAAPAVPALTRIADVGDWFWDPTWEALESASAARTSGSWLVVGDPDDSADDLVTDLARELTDRGARVDIAATLEPERVEAAQHVVLVGGRRSTDDADSVADLDRAVFRWTGDAGAVARSLGARETSTTLAAVTTGATDAGGTAARPADALAQGVVRVAPREFPGLRTVMVDLDVDRPADVAGIVDELIASPATIVAHRDGARLVPGFSRRHVPAPSEAGSPFRDGGTYLVTGGLGDIGFAMARHLAADRRANLVIVSSSALPEGLERDQWLARHGSEDPTSRRIRRAMELQSIGTKVVVVAADLADPASVRLALDNAERQVGRIDGAVHAAAQLRDRLIELATPDDIEVVLGAKARGAAVLLAELERRGAEALLLVSSTSSFLAAEGQSGYVAANAYLDALAGDRDGLRVVTMNSGAWAGTGMAAEMARRLRLGLGEGERITHPILVERHDGRNGAVYLVGRLDTSCDWVVDEHRTDVGRALLPGSGHVELMLAALRHAGLADHSLRDVSLLDPLTVADGVPVTVRVTVDRAGPRGTHAILIESDRGRGKAWHLHSEGAAAPDGDERPALVAGPLRTSIDPLAGPRRSLQFGPHWDAVVGAEAGDGVAVAELALDPSYSAEAGAWLAHPALVDVATAVAIALRTDDGSAVMVPVGYETVLRRGEVPTRLRVTAVRRPSSNDDVLVADIAIADLHGQVVLDVRGIALRAIADTSNFAVIPDDRTIATALPAAGMFVELAEGLGIRAEDTVDVFERITGDGAARLIVSSVDLADLDRPPVSPTTDADAEAEAAAAGQGGLVGTLMAMWSELLGIEDLTEDDNFFDLGGHSLIAIRLMTRIHRELEVRLQLAALFDAPTVRELADLILAERPDLDDQLRAAAPDAPTEIATTSDDVAAASPPVIKTPRKTLIRMNNTGTGTPLTIVHGAGGNVLFLSPLARMMRNERPLNGIQAVGIDDDEAPDSSVEQMADRYVTAIRADRPGPYMLGGYSGGGIVAMAVAHQLVEAGEDVQCVVLIDSIPAGLAYPDGWSARRNVAKNLLRHGWKPLSPYLKSRIGTRVDRLLNSRSAEPPTEDERAFFLVEREEHGFVDLFDHFAEISLSYEMPIYDFEVILLKADDVWPYQPRDYYWQRSLRRELTIVPVPGNHFTMVVQPDVAVLWQRLKPLLERFEARQDDDPWSR